ncbi:MAG: hypothetical protein P4L64_00195 [Caulobacteraceae bacterium]|nr:hypothetical protein [Caulobacteraceae bacterium]
MDIRLNFINESNDTNNSSVVIFQKNVATDFEETALAWEVIQNCGQGCNHPFVYPMAMSVGIGDSWGNYTPRQPATHGQLFTMQEAPSGNIMRASGEATSPSELQVLNSLSRGAIKAVVYRAGKPVAMKTSIAPQQKAVFKFTPTLWIGVASQVSEGELMNSAIISSVNTELSLLGLASADIVMTGGGPGPTSTPFQFNLANIDLA